jgi:carbamoyl-phosphate synthase large subunit
MNILITAAGRRTALVRAFREALNPSGGLVVAADVDPLAPALFAADAARRLPSVGDPSFADEIERIVVEERIGLVVPTIDPELVPLARLRGPLAAHGCVALVSDETLLVPAGDKLIGSQTFQRHGLRVATTWTADALPDDLPEQLFVKPRKGNASLGASRATRDGVAEATHALDDAIVQEYIDAPEVTIDILLDLDGNPVHYVPRLRIRTLAGESIEGVTIADEELRDWMPRLLATLRALGGRGPITAQMFLTPGEPTLSEVNPRFGGGFPLADAAGGRYPAWLVARLVGAPYQLTMGDYEVGLYMTRSYSETFVRSGAW